MNKKGKKICIECGVENFYYIETKEGYICITCAAKEADRDDDIFGI